MIKKILSGYLGVLSLIARVLLLLAACLAIGFCVVYPLWRLATANPALYTAIFLALAALLAAFLVARACARAFGKSPRAFVVSLSAKLVLLASIAGSVALVLAWHRALALASLVAGLVAYGVLAFGIGAESSARQGK
jgi:hypothetical protein